MTDSQWQKKKVGIVGFTQVMRKKELDKVTKKMEVKGWIFVEYEDSGMMNSYAVFKRPLEEKIFFFHKKWFTFVSAFSFVIAILGFCMREEPSPVSERDNKGKKSSSLSIKKSEIEVGSDETSAVMRNIGLDTEKFISLFNTNWKRVDKESKLVIKKTDELEDKSSIITAVINKHLLVMIYADINKNITQLMFIGQGDGTLDSGARILSAVISLVKSANNTSKFRDEKLNEIALSLIKSPGDLEYKHLSYSAAMVDRIGFMLTVTPVKP